MDTTSKLPDDFTTPALKDDVAPARPRFIDPSPAARAQEAQRVALDAAIWDASMLPLSRLILLWMLAQRADVIPVLTSMAALGELLLVHPASCRRRIHELERDGWLTRAGAGMTGTLYTLVIPSCSK